MNIHLVQPSNTFSKLKDNVWESGSWVVADSQAEKLVGGEIYFHRKRQEPSFYGGTIIGYWVHMTGQHQGKVVFQLRYSASCRDVKTGKSGWSKDVKIVELEA